jgi:hypothetical protein
MRLPRNRHRYHADTIAQLVLLQHYHIEYFTHYTEYQDEPS